MRNISENAARILQAKYLLDGETVEAMIRRIASAVAEAETESEKWTSVFQDLLASWDFVPGGRILAGAGTPNGQLFNCFVLPIDDSMESIFDTLKNTALVLKAGGGTGFSFSRLRPKGDVVATSRGIASGPVSFIKVFDSAASIIRQGGMRRGANMAILRVDHPDIREFIECKAKEGELPNFNISVGITDKFMQALENGEDFELIHPNTREVVERIPAQDIFDLMVEMAWRNGEPGAIFLDTINRSNPTPALGEIESTNPCIVGDALVATEHGLMRMEELVRRYADGRIKVAVDRRMLGMSQLLFDGTTGQPVCAVEKGVEFLPISRAFKTGMRPTVKVRTKSGYELILTPDHKVMTSRGWVMAGKLIPNKDEILIQSGAGLFNCERRLPFEIQNRYKGANGRTYRLNLPQEWSYELGFVLGWIVGDGWVRSGDENCRVGFTFGEEDLEVMEKIRRGVNGWYGGDIKPVKRKNGTYHLSYHSKFLVDFFLRLGVKPVKALEKEVPESIFTAPLDAVIGFLKGLFSADGTTQCNEEYGDYYIRLTSKSLKLLKGVQLLLLNLGIKSRIFNRSRPPRNGLKYRTVSSKDKVYRLDGICYELSITRQSIKKFGEMIGFGSEKHSDRLKQMAHKRLRNDNFTDVVESVEEAGFHTVYDLTVPVAHSFVANGMAISNCGEQPLLPNEACCLGSINLANLVQDGDFDWERLGEVTRLAVRFLDDVIDVTRYPLPEIEKMSKGNRKIGLGVMGWADALFQMGIPYDSEEGISKARAVMKFINETAWESSEELAREKSPFPFIEYAVDKDRLRRNAAVTTIAPTGSISMISDCSSGIEPVFALVYYKKVLDSEKLPELNKYLIEALEKRGLYSDELIKQIEREGSIQGIDGIPEDIKRVFVTAMDISPEWHVRMQAAFQEYTDNAVSKTINMPNSATKTDVANALKLAYQLGCKGITIYRYGSRDDQILNLVSDSKVESKGEMPERVMPRPRPIITSGGTVRMATGCGKLYVTINEDEKGLIEVFVNAGKSGGCVASQNEAIGRLISLGLRSGVDVQAIIKEMRGIKCPQVAWQDGDLIESCADAIGRAIDFYLRRNGKVTIDPINLGKKITGVNSVRVRFGDIGVPPECPECGGLLEFAEGCVLCRACGYTKCG